MQDFQNGFRATLPLWLGMVPFAIAYALTAHSAGLSLWQTQLMSLTVFSGGAQFSAAGMFLSQSSAWSIVLATFLLNVRHLLYGLSLMRHIPMTLQHKLLSAYFLTDEAYGLTVARDRPTYAFLMGASMGIFVSWNAATLIGSLLGERIQNPSQYGIDFVFPLAFLALLIPQLKNKVSVFVALCSGVLAYVLSLYVPGGVMVLLVGILGSLLGAWLTRGEP